MLRDLRGNCFLVKEVRFILIGQLEYLTVTTENKHLRHYRVCNRTFSNSLIIHQAKTKEITTVEEV